MAKQNILIEGRNIYYDKHNRPIYYVKRQKRGYRISSELERQYKVLSSRIIIALIMFIFLYLMFKVNIYISIILSILAYIFLEFRFRKLLNNCVIIENFEPHKDSKSNLSTDTPLNGLILRAVLYLLCGVLLIINAHISPDIVGDTALQVVSDVIGICSFYFAVRYIIVIYKKLKGNKKV